MRKISLLLVVVLFAIFSNTKVESFDAQTATSGSLEAFTKKGKHLGNSPLKHTKVKADISGFLARVTVEQEFENNFNQPIEAIYTFPLSENSAVDNMTMKIGSRTIRGKIKRKEEARKIYEQAKTDGKTASLLDQERPNVFTQSVANILPNETIVIEISYVENLKYEDGSYEFVFPMTVAPRYNPASVKDVDAAKVNPPVALKTRAGHDISIEVNLDAGVPIENISSTLHEINSQNLSSNSAKISLKNENEIPNKDFILKYDVTGKRIEDAILTHRDERGGFFTMMLSPPEDFRVEDVSPKEIVFVVDTSGSMSGFPLEKAKEAMNLSLEGLYPNDKFNLITFAGNTDILFNEPVYATQENLEKAKAFLESRNGGGGTEMMTAIKAALKPSGSSEHLRIVNFMTDGLIGNESEILAEIQKNPNARVFSFGIGDSINRFLLSKMAEEGRGEVSFVTLQDDGSKAARKFHERIRNPLLTDISIDWNGLPIADVYPKRNPDLFDIKPVVINGRYTKAASGTIKLKGKIGGQNYEREIKVDLPETEAEHDVLATLWARKRIDELSSKSLGSNEKELKTLSDTIKNLGLEFRLLTEFTSFVAVEEVVRTQGGKPVTVEVPVELANGTFGENEEGVSYGSGSGGVIDKPFRRLEVRTTLQKPPTVKYSSLGTGQGSGTGGGNGSGSGNGNGSVSVRNAPPPPPPPKLSSTSLRVPSRISGGVVNGKATSLPAPSYPAAASAANIKGSVNVAIVIDESGNVISATAVSGHPLLRSSAVTAAQNAKFAPTFISGQPVKVSGVVVYNFGTGNSATVVQNLSTDAGSSKLEELTFTIAQQKLHFWLYQLVESLGKSETKSTEHEVKFVKNGKALIQIQLSDTSAETMSKLKDAGFEISANNSKNLIFGEIAVEKIVDLVEIKQVKYILPKVR